MLGRWCFIFFFVISVTHALQIKTHQGDINGTYTKTLNGREIYAFLGIPYAKPPVGDLRFKNPVPFGKWEGVKDGTKDGPVCLQYNVFNQSNYPEVFGSEDCLYLNVFTPNVTEPKKYPVMVFIHGGGFMIGTGTHYGPDYLLDKDIVFVAMNYRLGALGFASMEDTVMSGNWGLKDQSLALKWVQENIAEYGGNPESVTVFGESAGAASVHYQMLSPLSKGLFHKAIIQSGSAHCPWSRRWPGEMVKRTKKFASFLHCPTYSSDVMVECLRELPSEPLLKVTSNLMEIYSHLLCTFSPVIEPKEVDDAFLTEDPLQIKSFIPIIIGINKDDGSFLLSMLQMNYNLNHIFTELDKDFHKFYSVAVGYSNHGQDTTEMMKEVRKFYFGDAKIDLDQLQKIYEMYTDGAMLQCTTSAVRSHEGPAYMYQFSHKGQNTIAQMYSERQEIDYGVTHADELLYLFPFKNLFSQRNISEEDWKMLDTMISLWTNFAIHGNPTPDGSQFIWNQVNKSDMNALNIENRNMTMVKNLFSERDKFWQELNKKNISPKSRVKIEL